MLGKDSVRQETGAWVQDVAKSHPQCLMQNAVS